MKLYLIVPTWEDEKARKKLGLAFKWPPLNMPIIAALTPKDIEVKIIDENIEDVNPDDVPDLVGITCMTAQAPRAYSLAKEFRKRGAKVIIGGIHASALPEEASKYADAVVIGEAEPVWHRVIDDFKKGKLQKFYKANKRMHLENLPEPRRDLLKLKKYVINNTIQVSRGCPHACDFCTVTKFFGAKYRLRPVKDVIKEIESLRGNSLRSKIFAFIDDNIAAVPPYTEKLCKEMIPLKIWWGGQATINVARNRKLVELMAKSGCKVLFCGLESISTESLKEAHKSFIKPHQFKEYIKVFHDYGIAIEGAFIFGFDSDDKSVFYRTVEFADKVGVDAAQFGILTPFPGTNLYNRLKKEGRILTENWEKYTIGNVVYKPAKMTPEELQEGTDWAWDTFYSLKRITKRIWRMIKKNMLSIPTLLIQISYRSHISKRRKLNLTNKEK